MQPQFSGGTWRDGAAPLALRYLFALFLFVVALAARFMLVDILPARGFPSCRSSLRYCWQPTWPASGRAC